MDHKDRLGIREYVDHRDHVERPDWMEATRRDHKVRWEMLDDRDRLESKDLRGQRDHKDHQESQEVANTAQSQELLQDIKPHNFLYLHFFSFYFIWKNHPPIDGCQNLK